MRHCHLHGPVVLVALVAGVLLPRSASTAPKPVAPVLYGTVYLPNGKPAPHAVLEATGWIRSLVAGRELAAAYWAFTLRTDAQGRYLSQLGTVPGMEPVTGSSVQWDVTLISQQGIGYAHLVVEAKASQDQVHQDIHLLRGDRVSGTVTGYPGGKPMRGARVCVGLSSGIMKNPVVSETRTDRRGRFRIPADLPPGDYLLGAAQWGYGMASLFSTDSKNPARDYQVQFRLIRHLQFRGQVLNANGSPLRTQRVLLTFRGGKGEREWGEYVVTDHDGRFAYSEQWGWEEINPWWLVAFERGTVGAAFEGHTSPPVGIEPVRARPAEVVLKLR